MSMQNRFIPRVFTATALSLTALLAACGGGGGGVTLRNL